MSLYSLILGNKSLNSLIKVHIINIIVNKCD